MQKTSRSNDVGPDRFLVFPGRNAIRWPVRKRIDSRNCTSGKTKEIAMPNLSMSSIFRAAIIAGVAGILLGMLNAFIVKHGNGNAGMPLAQIALMSAFVGGLSLFVSHQMRGNNGASGATSAEEQQAKLFLPDSQNAVVYIFRDAFYATLVGFDIRLNSEVVGQTRGKTFLRLTLAPGQHVLSSINPQNMTQTDLTLHVIAGKIGYFEHSVRFAAKGAQHDFNVSDDSTAQSRVRRCRLIRPASV
jgi:hypothetical protein